MGRYEEIALSLKTGSSYRALARRWRRAGGGLPWRFVRELDDLSYPVEKVCELPKRGADTIRCGAGNRTHRTSLGHLGMSASVSLSKA
jgi:hypothetical protein